MPRSGLPVDPAAPDSDEKEWVDEMVRTAVARIPFYRDHLAGADTSRLSALPTFHKQHTAGYGRFPLSADGVAGAHRVIATSGTTGNRLYVAVDRADWDRAGDWWSQVAQAAGLGSGDVLLNTHCYGLWIGGPALDLLAHRGGACLVPLGPVAPERVLELLTAGVGSSISATPSYLRRLVETAEATGFDLAGTGLRVGFIGAETAEPALRRKLLSRMPAGFRWVELYGLTETCGPTVAFAPDPAVPELTLNLRDYRVEVLDPDTDRPAALGAVGELTVTTRWPQSRSPLVRYRTRDLVRVTAGDPAAPTRISQILGRADDARKIGGVLMYPSAVAEIVSGILPASAEWRAVVRYRGEDAELVLEAEAGPERCEAVRHAFDQRVGLAVTVLPVTDDRLTRSRAKTRRFVVEAAQEG
jgi:phenylacetate-CoA ligase